jgi:chromosome segregation ATPase
MADGDEDDDDGELAALRRELAATRAELERARREAEAWRVRAEAARGEIERALAEANSAGTAVRALAGPAVPEEPARPAEHPDRA